MFNLRDAVVFLAGAQFFHALSHFLLPYIVKFPVTLAGIALTPKINILAILINTAIMVLLLLLANWLGKREKNRRAKA